MASPYPPVAQSTAATAQAYNSQAADYDRLWSPVIKPTGRHLLEALPLAGASRILDIGSGTGALLPYLRSAAPNATVIGVDRAVGMLRIAQLARPGSLAVMDCQQLAIASSAGDVAVLAFCLFHMPDPLQALIEVHRALRAGGTVGIVVWGDRPTFTAAEIWERELESAGAGPDPLSSEDRNELMNTPEKLQQLVRRAGFTAVKTWSERFTHIWTVEDYLRVKTGVGASRRRFQTLAPEAQQTLLALLRRRYAELSAQDFSYSPEVVFAVGRR